MAKKKYLCLTYIKNTRMKRTILLTAAILCAAGTRAQEAYDLLIPEPTRQAEISYAVFCLKKKTKKLETYIYLSSRHIEARI